MTDGINITVKLATALAVHADNQKRIACDVPAPGDLNSVLDALDGRFPGLKAAITGNGRDIIDSINVYLNGDNVRYLGGLSTEVKEGDIINIIPAAAAG